MQNNNSTKAIEKQLELYKFILQKYKELSPTLPTRGLCFFFVLLENSNMITHEQKQFLKGEIDAFMAAKKIEMGNNWPGIDCIIPERAPSCWRSLDAAKRIEYLQNKIEELATAMQNNNSTNQDRINELICGIENCAKYLETHNLTTKKEVMQKKAEKTEKIQKYTQELKSLLSNNQ